MATEPENIECSLCGASLRPGAVFCHKCGAKFAPVGTAEKVEAPESQAASKAASEAAPDTGAVSSAWFKGDISSPEIEAAPEKAAELPAEPRSKAGEEFQKTISDAAPATDAAADTQSLKGPAAEALPVGVRMSPTKDTNDAQNVKEADEPPPIPAPEGIRAKPLREAPKPAPTDALRRKPKLQKEKIEVVWEQPESGFNAVFVIGTIVIFVLVLLILMGVYFVK
jgi:hypothetical protein